MKSGKYKLSKREIVKGVALAAISSALFWLQDSLEAGSLRFDWRKIGMAAVGGAVAYLIKTFFEGEKKQNPGV